LQSVNAVPSPKYLNTIIYHTSRYLSMILFDLIRKVTKIALFKRRECTLQKIDIFFPSLKHQIWRWTYYFFNKEEVTLSVKKRKGECKRCGGCCHTSIRCSSLSFDESGYAMCKEHDRRPHMCKLYPFSRRDHFSHLKDKCGYWYDE